MTTLTAAADAVTTPRLNAASLARDARRRAVVHGLLTAPAILVVVLVVVVPIVWMTVLSFLDEKGQLSLINYEIFFTRGDYLPVIATTFRISAIVVLVAVLLGYPVTYLLATLPPRIAALGILAVMLPYLTSVLVRTYAWLVLLGRRGIINQTLMSWGLTADPIPLVFNATGTVVGMVHILLPLLVLPLYASMRAIDPNCMRAAASLGANPTIAFWLVFFRLSLPGLVAGSFLIFVVCLGFFITPAVLGGGRVTMMAQQIATAVAVHNHFGVASALGVALLLVTIAVLTTAYRIGRSTPGRA